MIVMPLVDLRDGGAVAPAAAGGARMESAVGTARDWAYAGFRRLHVIDLDAEAGTGSNIAVVEELARDGALEIQAAGDFQSAEQVQRLFEAGISQVVVGDRAIEEPEWLANLTSLFPGLIIVATEVRERRVATRGWVRTLAVDILDVVEELNGLPLGGVLINAAHRAGQLGGTDLTLMEDVADAADVPIIACGGITSMTELRALEHRGIAAAVIGTALYSGALDARAVAQEFGE
jgi:phosphoribosylformimino-5-aminoimidazole carboxamide ribotide isomerase